MLINSGGHYGKPTCLLYCQSALRSHASIRSLSHTIMLNIICMSTILSYLRIGVLVRTILILYLMLRVLQFFNPGAFAPVNTLQQAPPTGTNPQEPQDDAVSINNFYCYSSTCARFRAFSVLPLDV